MVISHGYVSLPEGNPHIWRSKNRPIEPGLWWVANQRCSGHHPVWLLAPAAVWCYEAQLAGINKPYTYEGWWFGTWFFFHNINGVSSFPLTFIVFKMGKTTNQSWIWRLRQFWNSKGSQLCWYRVGIHQQSCGDKDHSATGEMVHAGFSVVSIWCWWHMLWLYGFGDQIARGVFCICFSNKICEWLNDAAQPSCGRRFLALTRLGTMIQGEYQWERPLDRERWKTWVGRHDTEKMWVFISL